MRVPLVPSAGYMNEVRLDYAVPLQKDDDTEDEHFVDMYLEVKVYNPEWRPGCPSAKHWTHVLTTGSPKTAGLFPIVPVVMHPKPVFQGSAKGLGFSQG